MRRVQSNTLDVGIDVHLKNWSTAILSKHSVLRRFLQVDCEGPTLISYIVAKHLAHASRGTISHHRTCRSAYGGSLNCDAIGYKELSLTDNPRLQAYLL